MHAELIIYNGTIYTLDSLHPTAEAVAIADGRILAVGQLEDVEATAHANTRRLNLAGRTLIPGFNDACAHLWEVGRQLIGANQAEPTDFEAAILAAAKAYLRYGITSVTDTGVVPAQLETYRRLAAERRMPFRINVIPNRYTDDGAKVPLPERFESNWLRVDTVRLVADGDLANGNLRYTRGQMRGMIWDIHRAGLRASVHAAGEAAIEQAIEAMEYASKRLVSRMKHRIEQFALPSADHLNRCRYRISVVMLPAQIHTLAHLPAALVSRLYPLRAAVEAGLMIALGSGTVDAADINPMRGLLAAANRLSTAITPVAPEQAIPISEALPLYITGSALAAGEDHLKGSIAPGKYADLAVLSGDPLRAPIDRLSDLVVELTLVNGQVLYAA